MKVKRIASIFMLMLLMIIPISSLTNSKIYENMTGIYENDKDLSSWWWEPLELLSDESDSNNYFPRIAIYSPFCLKFWLCAHIGYRFQNIYQHF